MTTKNNMMTLKFTDGSTVLFSYNVPVAALVPGRGYVVTDRFYSQTTSKHMNKFTGKRHTVISDSELRALVDSLKIAL